MKSLILEVSQTVHFSIFLQISLIAFTAQVFFFFFFFLRLILQRMDQMQEETSLNQNDWEDRPFRWIAAAMEIRHTALRETSNFTF